MIVQCSAVHISATIVLVLHKLQIAPPSQFASEPCDMNDFKWDDGTCAASSTDCLPTSCESSGQITCTDGTCTSTMTEETNTNGVTVINNNNSNNNNNSGGNGRRRRKSNLNFLA